MPSILILGAGAVAQYLAARLIAAGRDVTIIARPESAARLATSGITFRDETSAQTNAEPSAETHPVNAWSLDALRADPPTAPFDVVLVAVKSPGLQWAADALAVPGVVGNQTAIVPLLNGLAQIDTLRAAAPRGAVLGATVRIVTSVASDGAVVLHQPFCIVTIGSLTNDDETAARRAADALSVSGIDAVVTDDAERELWLKWHLIVTSGVLGVLGRGSVGEIVAVPGGVELVDAVLAETTAVAAASGHRIDGADLASTRALHTASGSRYTSSLYRDVVAGRAGESEHIVGDFARRARELGVATPLIDAALVQMRVVTRR